MFHTHAIHHTTNAGTAVMAHHANRAVVAHHAVHHAVGGSAVAAHHGFLSMMGTHLLHSFIWQAVRRGVYAILPASLKHLAYNNWLVGAILAAIVSTICYAVYRMIRKHVG